MQKINVIGLKQKETWWLISISLMEVIFHYVDIKVIYDNMHDYFANMQHYKVNDTARKYT